MKRFRNVSVYYRNSDGIMKKIPNVRLYLTKEKYISGKGYKKGDNLVKVYTLPPLQVPQELILED